MNESSQQAGGDAYRVEPSRLAGRVRVSGAKNSALRLLAASVLTPEPVQLSNYPDTLLDAQVREVASTSLRPMREISARHSPPSPLNSVISCPGCRRSTWAWRAAPGGSNRQAPGARGRQT